MEKKQRKRLSDIVEQNIQTITDIEQAAHDALIKVNKVAIARIAESSMSRFTIYKICDAMIARAKKTIEASK